MKTRLEKDSVGALEIPADAYYGIHSFRAKENFTITKHKQEEDFIRSLVEIKKACAMANRKAGLLTEEKYKAIVDACDYILAGNLFDQFITDPIQGGAGTSSNMNANEVIANKGLELLGHEKGDYTYLHPNDDINMGQSTNDVYPSAGKLTIIKLAERTCAQLEYLVAALRKKAEEFKDIYKMGRTQLQDAVPVNLGDSFLAFIAPLERDIARIRRSLREVSILNMSGTAVGTCINASEEFHNSIIECLREVCGHDVYMAEDLVEATQNLDGFVYVSGAVKTCAVNMSKMCNDLRLMSSGPKTGLGEIVLPPRQNGSSIMPGKINPVIPEVVTQVAFNIIGNDMTVTLAAEAGQLELNAFEPVLFYNLFESIVTLGRAAVTLADNCIAGIVANAEVCRSNIDKSAGIATALCPHLGYVKSAEIAKNILKSGKTAKEYIVENGILTEEEADRILNPEVLVYPFGRKNK